jgi:hypothetical protein
VADDPLVELLTRLNTEKNVELTRVLSK